MLRDPDEQTCRQEVRRILSAVPSDSNIHSVHEGAVAGEQPPLSTEERDRLAALPLPGILTIVPDLPRQPGLPTTSASLDDRQLDVRADGSFFVHVAPGEHTLVIRHAGGQSDACIRIEACERIALTAHGSHLARHERVSPGACGTPGLEAATGDD